MDFTSSDADRYEHGKTKLMELRSQRMHYGPCWTAALESLETGCRQLTEDVQHELALKFVRCFLLKTGRQVPTRSKAVTRMGQPYCIYLKASVRLMVAERKRFSLRVIL